MTTEKDTCGHCADPNQDLACICVICFEVDGDHVLLPCGHGGYCAACAHTLLKHPSPSRLCPICRAALTAVLQISLEVPVGGCGNVLSAFGSRPLPILPVPEPQSFGILADDVIPVHAESSEGAIVLHIHESVGDSGGDSRRPVTISLTRVHSRVNDEPSSLGSSAVRWHAATTVGRAQNVPARSVTVWDTWAEAQEPRWDRALNINPSLLTENWNASEVSEILPEESASQMVRDDSASEMLPEDSASQNMREE